MTRFPYFPYSYNRNPYYGNNFVPNYKNIPGNQLNYTSSPRPSPNYR